MSSVGENDLNCTIVVPLLLGGTLGGCARVLLCLILNASHVAPALLADLVNGLRSH